MADFGHDFITQRYLRRYPDSKRAKSWAGVMVHIQTENGVWRDGGSGYTWAGKPDAWIIPFEDAVRRIEHCGPEKCGRFLRAEAAAPAPKFLNLIDGKIYVVVSQDGDSVTFKREGRETPYYLGREEFDRRFQMQTPPPAPISRGMNNTGSNGETLEKVCLNDPDNDPKNENIAPAQRPAGIQNFQIATENGRFYPVGQPLSAALGPEVCENRAPSIASRLSVTGFRGSPLRVVLSSGHEATVTQKLIDAFASPSPFDLFSRRSLDVLAERRRQVDVEDFRIDEDDHYTSGEMAWAATCYLQNAAVAAKMQGLGLLTARECDERGKSHPKPEAWPWDAEWWKPSGQRRDLVKAAALIIAEIERIDRAAPIPETDNEK